jgi:transcription antitermination protein NusB
MGQRRKARELAVQTLYALDFAELDGEFRQYDELSKYPDIMKQLVETENITHEDTVLLFADDLIKNSIINEDQINSEIEMHSENWSMSKIALLDRSILQLAVYELMFTDTPPAVVINEALEIAKKYSSEGSVKFLNGILDAVNKELLEKEKIEGTRV